MPISRPEIGNDIIRLILNLFLWIEFKPSLNFKYNSEAIGSRITLQSPDPSATDSSNEINSEFTVFNKSHSVTFTPSISSKSHNKAQLVKGTVESVHYHKDLNDELWGIEYYEI